MYKVHLLPALFGDAILIEYGTASAPSYILIDGGPYYGFTEMTDCLRKLAPKIKEIELLVVTHIDIDHIDGIITLLNQPKLPFRINQVWFNGWEELVPIKTDKLGGLQGEYLSELIKRNKIPHNTSFDGGAVVVNNPNKLPQVKLKGGMQVELLTPHSDALRKLKDKWKTEIEKIGGKEEVNERWQHESRYSTQLDKLGGTPPHPDVSVANASSIAFIGTFQNKSCLFAGDAMSTELLKSIEPKLKQKKKTKLELAAWKLAHHGSKKSTVESIMEKIDTKNVLISTNGDRYKHPDKQCISSLLSILPKKVTLYFNYQSKYNKIWNKDAAKSKFGHSAIYPPVGEVGITVIL